ncbi:hypothetical protein [Cellulomonas sp. Y8]|uniref:hypothetical protein n=1 Tax=Cellulomonas sp. Y8 TaxID=2591145 RepID=UPI003D7413FC
MRTTRVLSLTLATAALVAGSTAGAALADDGGGVTICFDGVTQTFGPGYVLESFLADGAAEGACDETRTEPVPELPVPVASTVGQMLDPRTPDPGSTTEVREPVVPTAVPDHVLPTAVPQPSAVTLDVPPALTTTGPLTEPEPLLVTPDPGSSVTVPVQGAGGGAATLPTDRLPDVRAAARTDAGTAPTSPTSVAPSQATTSTAPTAARAPHEASAAASAGSLAVTGAPALLLLLLALTTAAAGLALRGLARVRRAAR